MANDKFNNDNRIKITGMFDARNGRGGYSTKVNAAMIEALAQVKEGDFLYLNLVPMESRERVAGERGKDVTDTIAAYLEAAPPRDAQQAAAPAKKPTGSARPTKF